MSDDNKDQSLPNSPAPPVETQPQNPSIIETRDTTNNGIKKPNNQENPGKPAIPIDITNNRIMKATMVIAIATCIYVAIAALQMTIMKCELDQIKDTSAKTDQLITDTHTLATNAGTQAKNTETLATTTKDQVTKLKSLVDTANEQNKAMNKQLATMQQQLELTDRPWIKVTLEINGPLTFFTNQNSTSYNVGFRIRMKNIGKTVATKVRWLHDPFLIGWDVFKEPLERQNIILHKLSSTKPSIIQEGESIFPQEEIVNSSSIGGPANIDAFGFAAGRGRQISNILPWVVGCVEYQYATSLSRHYTCFNYTVVKIDPTKPPEGQRGAIHVGENLPKESVYLDPNNWGGRFVN